jgi:hypothetical protein
MAASRGTPARCSRLTLLIYAPETVRPLSEETQQGPFFLKEIGRKNPGALDGFHQEWVESLARRAEAEAAKGHELNSRSWSQPRIDSELQIRRPNEERNVGPIARPNIPVRSHL